MKRLFTALFILLVLAAGSALAYEKEAAAPIGLDNELIIRDYGFASSDADGKILEYGYVLQAEEMRAANAEKPLFYIAIENRGPRTRTLRLYIRGGRKYNCYWSKSIAIAPYTTYTFYGQGYDDAKTYAGSWSVDVAHLKTVRFGLYVD